MMVPQHLSDMQVELGQRDDIAGGRGLDFRMVRAAQFQNVAGALALGGLAETLVTLGLTVRVATQPVKRKVLFVPGLLGTALVGLVQLLIATLGAG